MKTQTTILEQTKEQEILFAQAYMAQMMIAGQNWGKHEQQGETDADTN